MTIQFCENCLIYTLCSLGTLFSYIKYNNCNEEFCIGCSKKRLKYGDGDGDDSICLKGYIKAFYLRIIYRRSDLVITSPVFHVMHIIFCLFFTPLFIGFISNFMGFIVHRKNRDFIPKDDLSKAIKIWSCFIYSIFGGILMFPYMILFFPFMVILLLPVIFSYTYYLHISISYIAAVQPGSAPLTNVGDY